MLRFSTRTVLLVLLGFSMSTQADTLGPLDGRSPDPSQMSDRSIEVGYVSEDDFTTIAGRFNYQYSPLLTLYGDVGMVDIGDADGNSFGIGARYYLSNQRIMPSFDVAVRASYHVSSVEFGAFAGAEVDLTELTFAVHFGGKEAFASNGMKWYGVVSYNRLGSESSFAGESAEDNDSEIGFGGGVYLPLGSGEVYAGIENIDDMYIGVGYRHFLGGAGY